MSDQQNETKQPTTNTPTVKKAGKKLLTSSEIKERVGINQEGDFPKWAVDAYGDTHKLRWLSQRKFYEGQEAIDLRGFEVVKDPKTNKIAKWGALVLGAMPKDLAEERAAAVRNEIRAQEESIAEAMESKQDRLRFELQNAGYDSSKVRSGAAQFSYKKAQKN